MSEQRQWANDYLNDQIINEVDTEQRHRAALTTCTVMTDMGCSTEQIRDALAALGVLPPIAIAAAIVAYGDGPICPTRSAATACSLRPD
jgi:hypothetical protein